MSSGPLDGPARPSHKKQRLTPAERAALDRTRRIKGAVKEGMKTWNRRRGVTSTPEVVVPEGESHQDEALRVLDELMASPLGRAWIETDQADAKGTRPDFPAHETGVLAPLPRRKMLKISGASAPSQSRDLIFKAGALATFRRLLIWLYAAYRFALGTLWAKLRSQDTTENRALRLRLTLERMGPTFVKLGQQLAMRPDVLPFTYCAEMSKMLDKVPPFPTEKAIATIEKSTGKTLKEMFAIFDPSPIGSASLACVFQAVLLNGDKVAVKVRRPGIGPILTADLRAFSWLTIIAEQLTLVRPGVLDNLRNDLATMLLEELDFRREARYTELFRKRARDMGQHYITAPRIYFQFSTDEVMVSEFVHGVFMGEVLGAVDLGDEETAAKIAERNIDPQIVSRRMLKIFNWEALENLLFHADPHPANILVQPGNRIVFIDFGSCGRFNDRTRRIWRRIHQALDNEDVGALVESALELMEPLPPIDLYRFKRELELLYWDWFYALESDHAEWYERSTGLFWIKLAGIARRYNVPMTLDTLLMFRTMFAYDSIMYRLWSKLDPEDEYQKYKKSASKRARKRVMKQVRKRVRAGGMTDSDFMRLEEFGRMTSQILDRVQHQLDMPNVSFVSLMGKAAFGVTIVLRLVTLAAAVHLLALLVAAGIWFFRGESISMWEVFVRITTSVPYQMTLMIMALLIVRRVLMRLEDVDVAK